MYYLSVLVLVIIFLFSIISDKITRKLKPHFTVLQETIGGRKANLVSSLTNNVYLTYTRANDDMGIDGLAVTDMCFISSWKDETCPPAYSKVSNPILLYSVSHLFKMFNIFLLSK